MQPGEKGTVLEIELGPRPPSEEELGQWLARLSREIAPDLVIAGMRLEGDLFYVAIVTTDRFREALRLGPTALEHLTPWGPPSEAMVQTILEGLGQTSAQLLRRKEVASA